VGLSQVPRAIRDKTEVAGGLVVDAIIVVDFWLLFCHTTY